MNTLLSLTGPSPILTIRNQGLLVSHVLKSSAKLVNPALCSIKIRNAVKAKPGQIVPEGGGQKYTALCPRCSRACMQWGRFIECQPSLTTSFPRKRSNLTEGSSESVYSFVQAYIR